MFSAQSFLLRDVLGRNAQICPENIAIVDGDNQLSYRELAGRVDEACAVLWSLGFRHGDRIGLLMENSMDYIELLLAVAKLGGVAVPLNIRLTVPELEFILNDAEASILVTSPTFLNLAQEVWSGVNTIRCGLLAGARDSLGNFQSFHQLRRTVSPMDEAEIPQLDRDSTVILLYTSGTTGSPKGCMTTQGSWVGNNVNMLTGFGISAQDRYLALLPFFHVAGLGTLFSHLHAGGSVVPMGKYTALGVAEMIDRHRITVAFLVPPMLQQLLGLESRNRYDLSSLRIMIGGAGFEPDWVSQRVEDELHAKFFGIYGQSESGNIVTAATRQNIAQRSGSYGYEMFGFRVRIVDEDDREVPQEVPGELTLRGLSVMKGYWKREEATQEALQGGWLHTGDIFVRHSDGALEMIDRKKYIIKTGGENVYPAEVEHVLLAHPAVADVSVIGITDPVWGETVKAFVVLMSGSTVSRVELDAWCREKLAGYKRPRYIEYIDEIPRNHSGKPLKNILEARPVDPSQQVPRN